VDTAYTMAAKLPKTVLGPATRAYDGLHDRLRETAADYLGQR
jgi:hypothetical protein